VSDKIAREVGKTKHYSRTFEVSESVLEEWRDDPEHWSDPVRFRFERSPWGWDLVMQRVEPERAEEAGG